MSGGSTGVRPVPVEAGAGGTAPTQADLVAAAVLGCRGVAALDGGGLVRVATYLPGRRVDGVRIDDDRVTVSVAAFLGTPLERVAERIRSAVAPLVPGRPVDVRVTDVRLPGEQPGAS